MRRRPSEASRSPLRAGLRLASAALGLVLALTQLGADCSDGVTPDCSRDPQCGPTEFGPSTVVPEGGAGDGDAADATSESEAGDAGSDGG